MAQLALAQWQQPGGLPSPAATMSLPGPPAFGGGQLPGPPGLPPPP